MKVINADLTCFIRGNLGFAGVFPLMINDDNGRHRRHDDDHHRDDGRSHPHRDDGDGRHRHHRHQNHTNGRYHLPDNGEVFHFHIVLLY